MQDLVIKNVKTAEYKEIKTIKDYGGNDRVVKGHI